MNNEDSAVPVDTPSPPQVLPGDGKSADTYVGDQIANSQGPPADKNTGRADKVNALIMVLGAGVYAFCQWGMLIALARLGTSTMVGTFALSLAVTAPIFLLASMGLRTVVATSQEQQVPIGLALSCRVVALVLAFAATVAVAWPFFTYETRVVLVLVGLTRTFDSASDVLYGFQLRYGQATAIAVSRSLQGALQLGLLASALYVWGSLVTAVAVMAVGSGIATVAYDIPRAYLTARKHSGNDGPAKGRIVLHWDASRILVLARLSFPLSMVALLAQTNVLVQRLLVDHGFGAAKLGVFSALSYIGVALAIATDAIFASMLASQASTYRRSPVEFASVIRRQATMIFMFVFLALVIGAIVGRPLLTLLYGPTYASEHSLFVLLLAASGVAVMLSHSNYALAAAHQYRRQPWPYVVQILLTGLIGAATLPSHNLMLVAWSILIGTGGALALGAALLASLLKQTSGPREALL